MGLAVSWSEYTSMLLKGFNLLRTPKEMSMAEGRCAYRKLWLKSRRQSGHENVEEP
jgi:hypothetical protein